MTNMYIYEEIKGMEKRDPVVKLYRSLSIRDI